MQTRTLVQFKFVDLIAAGYSLIAAAAACELPRTTIHEWKRDDPAFAEALQDARDDAADHQRSLHAPFIEAAIATLAALMSDPNVSPGIRLRAAKQFLSSPAKSSPRRNSGSPLPSGTHPTDSTLFDTSTPVQSVESSKTCITPELLESAVEGALDEETISAMLEQLGPEYREWLERQQNANPESHDGYTD